jgi:hypothetical protein
MKMGVITENQWPQCSRDECETLLVPGTDNVRIELRAGDAATILTAWAAWFHRNIRRIDVFKPRDYWGWSATNLVWNSNHLSGTAADLCATELPWHQTTMPSDQVDRVHQGLTLFETTVWWGRDWGPGQYDEMHFQINLPPGHPKLAEFAQRLRTGYLNIFGPQDPNEFPLPIGYYYGPLDGPQESVSGEYETDSQAAKDGLGRWQAALGIPVTKKWNDGVTPKAATTLQLAKGWPPNPLFGYGGVYQGEWDAVIKQGWRLPKDWDPGDVAEEPEPLLVKWGDYSQFQDALIDDDYPYTQVAFRASVADRIDEHFVENIRRAKDMVKRGKLKKIIAYHFWVRGYDNFATFKEAVEQSGGIFPQLCFMLDVEDGRPKWNNVGDQSAGANDFIARGQEYFQNPQAASGYLNFNANGDLWQTIPPGLKMIVPRYSGPDVPPVAPITPFGHQYADDEDTPPFGPSDINQSKMTLTQWLAAWGTNRG